MMNIEVRDGVDYQMASCDAFSLGTSLIQPIGQLRLTVRQQGGVERQNL